MILRPLRTIFHFEQRKTKISREVIAGLTTFTTMSYIVVVNPAILANAGIPIGPSLMATVLAAIFGCGLSLAKDRHQREHDLWKQLRDDCGSKSNASPPRTSPTIIRSGLCRRAAFNRSRIVTTGIPVCSRLVWWR